MISNLPPAVNIFFIATTMFTIWLFYKATNNSNIALILMVVWILIQACIARTGFYTFTDSIPPRFALLVAPPILLIIFTFLTPGGKQFIDSCNDTLMTALHTVRIPVELILLSLYLHKLIPQLMTFEGRNFDIVAGLSAPFIAYFGLRVKNLNKSVLIIWNIICLGLLFNIVINAVFSAPFQFQKFAFDQPNIAILYFPFIWLPCLIVPVVLFCHLASLRKLFQ